MGTRLDINQLIHTESSPSKTAHTQLSASIRNTRYRTLQFMFYLP